MRALIDVVPSAEQLSLFSRINGGVEVIRGAAGSGKTTTALLKLRSYIGSFLSRRRRKPDSGPLKILVLTYNRTLAGYVTELAHRQFAAEEEIELEVSTFAKWARTALGNPEIISSTRRHNEIRALSGDLNLPQWFIEEEVEYLMGKFLPADLPQYSTVRRDGRGSSPRVDRPVRETLLSQIVTPYNAMLRREGIYDWNDLAVDFANNHYFEYDIVIVDEAQDFSANQIRAVMNQLAPIHAVTFVLDTAQRIYARGFTWQEVGITIRPENSFTLGKNYRNTREIARFAASIISDLAPDADGTMPNFEGATRNGPRPIVLEGKYSNQVAHVITQIRRNVNLDEESVAFLHPKGGRWFDFLRSSLDDAGLPYVEISREAEWPQGPENIALSTLHSSKGLEFDHVVILGLNSEVLPHGEGPDDDKLTSLRRLLAMGIGRAKATVTLGYSPNDKSDVIDFVDQRTFELVRV